MNFSCAGESAFLVNSTISQNCKMPDEQRDARPQSNGAHGGSGSNGPAGSIQHHVQSQYIVGGSGNLHPHEKLEGATNYGTWSFTMKNMLIQDGLWKCVTGADTDEDRAERTLAKINLNVKPCCYPIVKRATSPRDAWNSLERAFEDKGYARRFGLQRYLFKIKLEDFESMESYVKKILEVNGTLSDIGAPLDDEMLANIMLGGLPPEYEPLIMALENTNAKLSTELIQSKLLVQDGRRTENGTVNQSTAFKASYHVKRKKFAGANFPKSNNGRKSIACYYCKEEGHIKAQCPKLSATNKSKGPQANQAYGTSGTSSAEGHSSRTLTFVAADRFSNDHWYIDSGATDNISRRKDWLRNFKDEQSDPVMTASKQKLECEGRGEACVHLSDNDSRVIVSDVKYVPGIAANLLSVSKMVQKGLTLVFNREGCKVYQDCAVQGDPCATATLVRGMYRLDGDGCNEHCEISHVLSSDAVNVNSQMLWHRRLGHLHANAMEQLRNGLAEGINFRSEELEPCVSCFKGKITRKPFPKRGGKRATEKLGLVHSDVIGPMNFESYGGAKY